MYDRVLLAADGSEPSVAAAEHALDVAGTYGATLHAVFVVDTDTGALTVSKNEVRDALRDLGREAGGSALRDVEARAEAAGVEPVTDVLEGRPDDRILGYVDDERIDLVVMGTHGRTGIERRITGSVAGRVVREAPVPVMTVPASADD